MTQFDRDVARSLEMLGMNKPSVIICASGEKITVQSVEQRDPRLTMFGRVIKR